MIVRVANDPLPHRLINIVDVSPLHSPISARPVGPSRWDRIRDRILGARTRSR